MENPVLEVKNLTKRFTLEAGFFARSDRFVYAVNDVSFALERGKTYGLVGESGCGKTTTARLMIRMYKADSGSVLYCPSDGDGSVQSVGDFTRSELRHYRERVKYVFQDPSRSMNPRMTVGGVLTSALRYSSLWSGKKDAREKAAELMKEIGLSADDLDRRPQEFSGGQRQRISIARGLIMEPEVMFCDEIVSALDVSVQGQILNLLSDIREKRGLSLLFIAHDLRVSSYFCDTIGVMYSGMLVEEAPAQVLYKEAFHPYTKLLFASGPDGKGEIIRGEVKSVLSVENACPFAHRCPYATEKCRSFLPPWKNVGNGHKVRCHLE